jgi:hypothetical protein
MIENEFILSFDIDWAPDYMLRFISDKLEAARLKATWFVTHDSEAVQTFRKNPLFECGIHPNFLPNSSHGNTSDEVLGYLAKIVPEAVSARSHAVVQSGALLNQYVSNTKIKIDSTTFLPEMPHIQALHHPLPGGNLVRVPFFWADDYEMCRSHPEWSPIRMLDVPGLKVMMFHPVHVFFNSPSIDFYQQVKIKSGSIFDLKKEEAEKLRYEGKGTAHFFEDLVNHLQQSLSRRICDLI